MLQLLTFLVCSVSFLSSGLCVLLGIFIYQIFSPYGIIEDIFIVRDDMKQSRGVYFVLLYLEIHLHAKCQFASLFSFFDFEGMKSFPFFVLIFFLFLIKSYEKKEERLGSGGCLLYPLTVSRSSLT